MSDRVDLISCLFTLPICALALLAQPPRTMGVKPHESELASAIEERIQDAGAGSVSVAFHDLATGREILIRADERFHPASTIKVPILMEVFHQVRLGQLKLDERIPIRNEFKSIAGGSTFSVD